MNQGPLLPCRQFLAREVLATPRLTKDYALLVAKYPFYRKFAQEESRTPFKALAFFFIENLLCRQGEAEYQEEKDYLFGTVHDQDMAMVPEADLSNPALSKYLDKGVLLKAFEKHYQTLEKLTAGKPPERVSTLLAEEFNSRSSSLAAVAALLFRCLALTASRQPRDELLQCKSITDPAVGLLVAQHLESSIVFFKNLVEMRIGTQPCVSALLYWNEQYAVLYPKGHCKAAVVGSFLEEHKVIPVVPFDQSLFKAILASPESARSDSLVSKESKSPSSLARTKMDIAIQVQPPPLPLHQREIKCFSFGKLDQSRSISIDKEPLSKRFEETPPNRRYFETCRDSFDKESIKSKDSIRSSLSHKDTSRQKSIKDSLIHELYFK
jgi:hypothetical protein